MSVPESKIVNFWVTPSKDLTTRLRATRFIDRYDTSEPNDLDVMIHFRMGLILVEFELTPQERRKSQLTLKLRHHR